MEKINYLVTIRTPDSYEQEYFDSKQEIYEFYKDKNIQIINIESVII